jgi:hypothetical protein
VLLHVQLQRHGRAESSSFLSILHLCLHLLRREELLTRRHPHLYRIAEDNVHRRDLNLTQELISLPLDLGLLLLIPFYMYKLSISKSVYITMLV